MRVSIYFISLAVFFAGRSQCAPVSPENALNPRDIPELNGFPLLGSLPVISNNRFASAPESDGFPLVNSPATAHHGLPLVGSLSSIEGIVKRSPGDVGSGLFGGENTGSLPGLGDIPVVGGGLPEVGSSLPGLEELSDTSQIPSLTTIPFLSSAPSLSSIPGVSSLGSLSSSTDNAKRSLAESLPVIGGGGLPVTGERALSNLDLPSRDHARKNSHVSGFRHSLGHEDLESFPGLSTIADLEGATPFGSSGSPSDIGMETLPLLSGSLPLINAKREIPDFMSGVSYIPGMGSLANIPGLGEDVPFFGSASGLERGFHESGNLGAPTGLFGSN